MPPEENLMSFHELSEKIHQLTERLIKNEVITEKDIQRLEQYISSIDKNFDDNVKQEVWDIKQSIKKISQNEKDIAVLNTHIKGLEKLFESQKEAIKLKEDKWYKNAGLWISIVALCISMIFGYINYIKTPTPLQQTGENNVSSNNKK